MSTQKQADPSSGNHRQDKSRSSDKYEGPFSYAAWVGMCIDEFVQLGRDELTKADRDRLLAQCPEGQEKECEEFLQTLPEVALALSSWDQPQSD